MRQILIIREPWCSKKHVVIGRIDENLEITSIIKKVLGTDKFELYYHGICDGPNGLHTFMVAQTKPFPYRVELYYRE